MASAFLLATLALQEPSSTGKLASQSHHARTVRSGTKLSRSVSAPWTLSGMVTSASVAEAGRRLMDQVDVFVLWVFSGTVRNALQSTVAAALACKIVIGSEVDANVYLDLYLKAKHVYVTDCRLRVIVIVAI